MEGFFIGEKEAYLCDFAEIGIRDNERKIHSFGKGRLILTNQRVNFTSENGVWEESLESIGVVSLSNSVEEFGGPAVLCQFTNEDQSYFWVVRHQDQGEVRKFYEVITKVLDSVEGGFE
ncbi:hypothetical protein SteCoe_29659 [Stentor coeruleus]|uniref:GLUE N-terminal domain-containing protein n=1 Tax=Stentor coeruleus TaxID=5963 RepID=A0A1R2B5E9_9CILI|nr:hypothetical protein SteCoe_29659 [Stentor coeruleus]